MLIRVYFNSIKEYYNTNVGFFPRVCTLNISDDPFSDLVTNWNFSLLRLTGTYL